MASWYVKYRTEFKDNSALDWKIDIQEYLNSDPGITTLTATGDPLTIQYFSDSDDFNEPIRPSKAIINIEASTDFSLIDLYSDEDLHFKVIIYKGAAGTDIYWQGFVITGEYSEPYNCPPLPVSITAHDGLNYLKNILFADSINITDKVETITYYNGHRSETQIIIDILAKVSITGFTEYVNIYETLMADSVDDSPLEQVTIDTDVFQDFYCWDVLKEIVKKYNAVMIQKAGSITIYRPIELTAATVYGRIFTTASAKSSTSFVPLQYINRSTNASNLKQYPDSFLMVKRGAKTVTINQDFGYKESWIDNWQIKGNTIEWGSPLNTIQNWTPNNSCFAEGMTDLGEADGMLINDHNDYAGTISQYMYQSFGAYAVTTADILMLEFDYLLYNAASAARANQYIYVMVKSDYDDHWLYDVDDHLDWKGTADYVKVLVPSAPVGSSGWLSFKKYINGLPESGSYTISLVALDDAYADLHVAFKNIKFYATSDEIIVKKYTTAKSFRIPFAWFVKINYEKKRSTKELKDVTEILQKDLVYSNNIKGIDLAYPYLLGDVIDADVNIDNITEQFKGALKITSVSLTAVAATFVTDHATDYSPGGVVLTSSGADVIFTAATAGTAFTGATSITNFAGDLDGTLPVGKQTANVVALARKDTVTLENDAPGGATITCNGLSKAATWDTDLATTAGNFQSTWAVAYAAVDVIVTNAGPDIIFTAATAGTDFTSDPTTITGSLAGYVTVTQVNVVAVKQVATITLSGTYGGALITCDAVSQLIYFLNDPTTAWDTIGGSENLPLLEIIGAEIKKQYSRPKQLLQMNIKETSSSDTVLNILGNIQDDLNTITAVNRKFVFNKGEIKAKERIWSADLIEIIE
jgi:hypothetical protein